MAKRLSLVAVSVVVGGCAVFVACGDAPPKEKSPSDVASAAMQPDASAAVVPTPQTASAPDGGASTNASALGPITCEGATLHAATKDYCLVTTRRAFSDASGECERMHGRLAVVDNADDAKALTSQIASPWGYGSGLWLGCSDEETEGKWKCNGKPLGWKGWAPGKPDNENALEDCAQWLADTGQWNDASCAFRLGYVCRGDAKMKCTGAGRSVTSGKTIFCAHGDDLQDWDGAKKACEATGGKLAVPATAEENTALFNALKLPSAAPSFQPNEGVWIGLSDRKEEGKFRWINDTPLANGNWMAGQPDDANGGEDCATLTLGDGKWNDLDCIRGLPFLCEGAKAIGSP